ncbi:MAG: hypothetical protein D6800_14670, partial [Candidatus Zixiibacteriota bacterium]
MVGGCVEVKIMGQVEPDGSAQINVRAVVVDEFVNGRYAEFSKNEIFPIDRKGVERLVAGLNGARLHYVDINPHYASQQAGNLGTVTMRRIEYQFTIPDINDIAFHHLNMRYYPYRDRKLFAFVVNKSPEQVQALADEDPDAPVNMITEVLTRGRTLTLEFKFPDRIRRTNGQARGW